MAFFRGLWGGADFCQSNALCGHPNVNCRDRLVVRTLRCGRSNPGSNPGYSSDPFFFFFSSSLFSLLPPSFTSFTPLLHLWSRSML